MKKLVRIPALIFITAFLLSCFIQTAAAQETDSYKIVSDRIARKDFVFIATTVSPFTGRVRSLTTLYDVRVKADSIFSNLPYFGKSDVAPITSEDAGIIFTSTQFEYSFSPAKKRSWNVEIKFKDQRNTQQFNFIIYDDGSASLNVTSNFRDPISFRGYIRL